MPSKDEPAGVGTWLFLALLGGFFAWVATMLLVRAWLPGGPVFATVAAVTFGMALWLPSLIRVFIAPPRPFSPAATIAAHQARMLAITKKVWVVAGSVVIVTLAMVALLGTAPEKQPAVSDQECADYYVTYTSKDGSYSTAQRSSAAEAYDEYCT